MRIEPGKKRDSQKMTVPCENRKSAFFCARPGGGFGVLLCEPLNPSSGVDQLLLAGEVRMAIRADFDSQHIALNRGTRLERVSACTVDGHRVIVGMNTGFHKSPFRRVRSAPFLREQGLERRR